MPDKTWTIGSDPACDVVVENATVSGRHCRLSTEGGTLTVEDLNSTNGTYVNGQRVIGSRTVSREDRITLGNTQPLPWPNELAAAKQGSSSTTVSRQPETRVITIGRSPQNTVVLEGNNVSSHHARLTVSADEIMLEDLGSTNGTSVGTVENKTLRAAVRADDTVFFGSSPYQVADLVKLAQPQLVTPVVKTDAKSHLGRGPARNKNTVLWATGAAAVVVVSLIAILVMAGLGTRGQQQATDTLADPETATLAADDTQPATPAPAASSVPSGSPEGLTPEQQLARSLFVLVSTDPGRKTPFRIGTAFAVDSQHIATTASVIQAMHDLQDNGFPQAMLYAPATGVEIEIAEIHVHPQYEAADADAKAAKQRYDTIYDNLPALDDPESEPPKPEEFELIKQQLLNAQRQAFEAMQRKTIYDVAVISIKQPLSQWLSGSDSNATLRPNLKLNVTGYAYDVEDQFFDPVSPIELSTMSSRIRQLTRLTDDAPPRLLASASASQNEYSYIGSPALNAQGQVVAVYARPTPPPGEAAAATFDAPLFDRVRECLQQ